MVWNQSRQDKTVKKKKKKNLQVSELPFGFF